MTRSLLAALSLTALLITGCKPDCQDVEADARELVAKHAACEQDTDCKVVDFATVSPGSCVGAFQCALALRADVEQTAFALLAGSISDQKRECGECIMASCIAPETLRALCNKQTKLCELEAMIAPAGASAQ